MPWEQSYNPLGAQWLSVLAACIPAVVLLFTLGVLRWKAPRAALAGLVTTLAVALGVYGMPLPQATAATLYGAAYGLLPIGWIILNVLVLFRICKENGLFDLLQRSLTGITPDRRLQLILVAFCLGAFLEGAAGFSTPVAVAASILTGLGFPALPAASLTLLSNTAPVPFAGLGTPLIALSGVTGLDLRDLTIQVALQLTLFDLLIPTWMVWALAGRKATLEVAPALLVTAGSFVVIQLGLAFFHGPWLINILAGAASLGALTVFLRFWKPARIWRFEGDEERAEGGMPSPRDVLRAWAPWAILSLIVLVWGLPQVKTWMDGWSTLRIPVPGLHLAVLRVPPVAVEVTPQAAIFELNWLSASGTSIFLACVVTGLWLRIRPADLFKTYTATLRESGRTLLTLSAMMAIGFVARYAGMDGTLGLVFSQTGALFPFFGTLLGWFGVFLTGSDTSSNVLFGSLQRISAEKLGFDPLVMAAANSTGGVMGKMINAQSVVVAAAATHQTGQEGSILRRVFVPSVVLAVLAGLVVLLFAHLK